MKRPFAFPLFRRLMVWMMSPGNSRNGMLGSSDIGLVGMWVLPEVEGSRGGYLFATLGRLCLVMVAMLDGLTARAYAVLKLSLLAASMIDLSTVLALGGGRVPGLRLVTERVSSQRAWKWPHRKSWIRRPTHWEMDSFDAVGFGPRMSISMWKRSQRKTKPSVFQAGASGPTYDWEASL